MNRQSKKQDRATAEGFKLFIAFIRGAELVFQGTFETSASGSVGTGLFQQSIDRSLFRSVNGRWLMILHSQMSVSLQLPATSDRPMKIMYGDEVFGLCETSKEGELCLPLDVEGAGGQATWGGTSVYFQVRRDDSRGTVVSLHSWDDIRSLAPKRWGEVESGIQDCLKFTGEGESILTESGADTSTKVVLGAPPVRLMLIASQWDIVLRSIFAGAMPSGVIGFSLEAFPSRELRHWIMRHGRDSRVVIKVVGSLMPRDLILFMALCSAAEYVGISAERVIWAGPDDQWFDLCDRTMIPLEMNSVPLDEEQTQQWAWIHARLPSDVVGKRARSILGAGRGIELSNASDPKLYGGAYARVLSEMLSRLV